jgi:hypothetical protein
MGHGMKKFLLYCGKDILKIIGENQMTIKEYEIWSEGFVATGQHGFAHHHGRCSAGSFKDACKTFFKDDTCFNEDRLTYWGCRLFDNEKEARETFG